MWIILAWIAVPILLLVAVYKYYSGNTDYWIKKGVTLVSLKDVASTKERLLFKVPLHLYDQRMYKRYRQLRVPYGGTEEMRKPIFYTIDLELIKHVLVKDFEFFVNRRILESIKKDKYFGDMLSLKENQEWKDLRSTMSPTFSTGRIRRMFDIFEESGTKFVKFVENMTKESNEIDLQTVCGKYTMDVIASAAFGVDSQIFNEKDPIFAKMGKRAQNNFTGLRGLFRLLMMFFFPKIANSLKIRMSDTISTHFFLDIISKAKKHRESSGEKRDDFLQLLLESQAGKLKPDTEVVEEAYDKDAQLVGQKINKIQMTDNILAQQCLLFFLAGFDTTETLLSFASYELALNPEVQEKLAAEIEDAVNQNGGKLTYDMVNQLEYLDKFVSEALRMHPPGVRTERVATLDYKVPNSDFVLPKDTIVAVPIYAIHHDEEYYPDPEKFDPERFSAENKAKRHPYAYMPFGQGPRNCIAMRFALIEGKTAIAKLAHNFILEPCSKTHIPMKYVKSGVMKPEGGMWLNVKPRRNTAAIDE